MVYVLVLPEQLTVFPLTVPGVDGEVLTVTTSDCAADEPQVLLAVTVTLPLVELTVLVIELEEEVPVHPLGKVHT